MSISAQTSEGRGDEAGIARMVASLCRPASGDQVAETLRIAPSRLGVVDGQASQDLDAVMNPGDPFERAVIHLRYDEQQTLSVIAHTLNTSPDVVSTTLMAVYRRIASALPEMVR